jgi:ADP-heptose:LPS heptosyltransferase
LVEVAKERSSELCELLRAPRPAVLFANKIGDALLTLPTMRALGELFDAPLTVICPKFAFDLCFGEVSSRHVDITELRPALRPAPHRAVDHEAVAAEVGEVDVLIDTVPWNMPSNAVVRALAQRIAPATSVGFGDDEHAHDIVVRKEARHSADLIFALATLFDPAAVIDDYAQPVQVSAAVDASARAIRDSVPDRAKVLVVHADPDWDKKRWPITRFVALLDLFLTRHPDFVVWVVGMGHEELNVGRHGDRVVPYLRLPLDVTMALVSKADLFLGIDSCMLHAADLARVPGVGLFGPTRPVTWGFRFAPHRHVDRQTIADITVEEVFDALEDIVQQHV